MSLENSFKKYGASLAQAINWSECTALTNFCTLSLQGVLKRSQFTHLKQIYLNYVFIGKATLKEILIKKTQ